MATAAFSESAVDLAIRRAAEKLGYSKLRHQQVRAVKNFVQGNDVFMSLPTGSGRFLHVTASFLLPSTSCLELMVDTSHAASSSQTATIKFFTRLGLIIITSPHTAQIPKPWQVRPDVIPREITSGSRDYPICIYVWEIKHETRGRVAPGGECFIAHTYRIWA